MTVDLDAEFIDLARAPTGRAMEWLIEQGVSPDIVHGGPTAGDLCGPIAVGRIAVAGGTFTFAEDAQQAFVHPVWESDGISITDLIAWFPADPSRWFLRLGTGIWLGSNCVTVSHVLETPLPIRKTPLAWLAHRGHGATPLNKSAARYDVLDIELVVADVEHGNKLEAWLTVPAVRPTILIARAA